MQRLIIATCLLATVLAQNAPAPARPPSPPYPPPRGVDGKHEMEEDKEPCPPRTGREWICKVRDPSFTMPSPERTLAMHLTGKRVVSTGDTD